MWFNLFLVWNFVETQFFLRGGYDPSIGSFWKILEKFNNFLIYCNGLTTFITLAPASYFKKTWLQRNILSYLSCRQIWVYPLMDGWKCDYNTNMDKKALVWSHWYYEGINDQILKCTLKYEH